jgi:hypothetical protein
MLAQLGRQPCTFSMYYSIASVQYPTWGDHRGSWEKSEFEHNLMIGKIQSNTRVSFGDQIGHRVSFISSITLLNVDVENSLRSIFFS